MKGLLLTIALLFIVTGIGVASLIGPGSDDYDFTIPTQVVTNPDGSQATLSGTIHVHVEVPAPPSNQNWLYPFRSGQSVYTTLIPANPSIDPASSSKISYFLAHDVVSPNMAIKNWSTAVRQT